MNKVIGIKVDVDTYEGMKQGVPALLELFRKYGIYASFFIPMGKDHTGRTIKRVFKKGFLTKASRVGVVQTYGIKTLLYGIVLPGPEIAKRNAHLLFRIREEGHEVGIHGFDHVYWHDHIRYLDKEKTAKELEKAIAVYREVLGEKPVSFAAPGWAINSHVLRYLKEKGFFYTSNTRGVSPFFPEIEGKQFDILEVPSTLPTLDEMVGVAGTGDVALADFFFNSLTNGINIMSIHTELEGRRWIGFLKAFIEKTLNSGYSFRRVIDIAMDVRDSTSLPTCAIIYGRVEGRAGEVSCQSTA